MHSQIKMSREISLHSMTLQSIIIISFLFAATTVRSADFTPIPADKSQISTWFRNNVKAYTQRKGTLNSILEAAEAKTRRIKVRKDGSGDYKTITDAINSIPSENSERVIVDIGAGVYNEKIKIERNKPFITLLGSAGNMPTLSFGGTAKEYGTVYSATLQVESDFFTASNLIIKNSAPRPDGKRIGAQAVAFRIAGDYAAFYNCKFLGFQDTLCDDKGRHFFKDCYIEGTVDFIFGNGKSLYLNAEINVIEEKGMTVITAHARESKAENTGFSFVHCKVTGIGSGTYLGRAWMAMPVVVFAYTDMDSVVNSVGWSDNFRTERDKTVLFGEYQCSGPGSDTRSRATFTKQLTDAEAKPYLSLSYIEGSSWLLPPPN